MKRKVFEQMVQEALDRVPGEFRKAMKNIAIVVKDRPGEEAGEETTDSDFEP